MHLPVVVIGAGHSGLAFSHCLTERSIEHVVLERGEVANTWRTERWDSFRLLTPNWLTRLPGADYWGEDPDGFMTAEEVSGFIEAYAHWARAPVQTGTNVESVRRQGNRYLVTADQGSWECSAVVIATGGFNRPALPSVATDLRDDIETVTPLTYRRPEGLRDGPVLVVGASASGVQIAHELRLAGRDVTVSVGEHVRLPRRYRGRDIFWWMERIGRLDEDHQQVDDLVRARHVPSPQLAGSNGSDLDLNSLHDSGVRLVGRLEAINGGTALLSAALPNLCKLADLKMFRLLDTIDQWIEETGSDGSAGPPHRPDPTRLNPTPTLKLDLGEYSNVVWATGYRSDYSWLEVPALDRKGEIRHEGGVVNGHPGLYRLGLNFLRRRKSSFIHGAEDDTHDLSDHLADYLRLAETEQPVGARTEPWP